MIRRLVVFGAFAFSCAFAQLQLTVVQTGAVCDPQRAIDMGAIETGDAAILGLRLDNTGTMAVRLDKIEAEGEGFLVVNSPKLPVTLLSKAFVEFQVRFAPSAPGGYNARLLAGKDAWLLIGRGIPGLTLSVGQPQGPAQLADGDVIDFGQAPRGTRVSRHLTLGNPSSQRLTVDQLYVQGDSFRGPLGAAAPITLEPGQSVSFDIEWEAHGTGAEQGTLLLNHLTIALLGNATAPPLPKFRISVDPGALHSGEQAKLSIKFDEAAQAAGKGLLRMDFIGKGDPAIRFISPAGRSAPFTIAEGEDTARFGEQTAIEFQSGTTAGTILFTATLEDDTEQASFEIAPEGVSFDSVRTTRTSDQLMLSISGFDNTRSASQVSFTFLDRDGRKLGNGPIRADVQAAFQQYFQNPEYGGAFVLRALFPVAGDGSRIASVDLEFTNSAGVSRGNAKMAE